MCLFIVYIVRKCYKNLRVKQHIDNYDSTIFIHYMLCVKVDINRLMNKIYIVK